MASEGAGAAGAGLGPGASLFGASALPRPQLRTARPLRRALAPQRAPVHRGARRLLPRAQLGGGEGLQGPLGGLLGRVQFRTLREGLSGADVVALQENMANLGYLPDSMVDGDFGPATFYAVQHWQEIHGLPTTGMWDAACRTELAREIRGSSSTGDYAGATQTVAVTAPDRQLGGAGVPGGAPLMLAVCLAIGVVYASQGRLVEWLRGLVSQMDGLSLSLGGASSGEGPTGGHNRDAGTGSATPSTYLRRSGAAVAEGADELQSVPSGRDAEFMAPAGSLSRRRASPVASPASHPGLVYASVAAERQRAAAQTLVAPEEEAWHEPLRVPSGMPAQLDRSQFLQTEALRFEVASRKQEAVLLAAQLAALQKQVAATHGHEGGGGRSTGIGPSSTAWGGSSSDVPARIREVEAALAALPRRIELLEGMERRLHLLETALEQQQQQQQQQHLADGADMVHGGNGRDASARIQSLEGKLESLEGALTAAAGRDGSWVGPFEARVAQVLDPLLASKAALEVSAAQQASALAAVQDQLAAMEARLAALTGRPQPPALLALGAAGSISSRSADDLAAMTARLSVLQGALDDLTQQRRAEMGELYGKLGSMQAALQAGVTSGADLHAVERRLAAVEAAAASIPREALLAPPAEQQHESLVQAVLGRLGLGSSPSGRLDQLEAASGSWKGAVAALQDKVAELERFMSRATQPRLQAAEADDALVRRLEALESAQGSLTGLQSTLERVESSLGAAQQGAAALATLAQQVAALEAALAAPPATAPAKLPANAAGATVLLPPPVRPPEVIPPMPMPRVAPAAPPDEDTRSAPLWRLNAGAEVLLQGFHWESHKHGWYNVVASKLADIKSVGFTGVWLPPSSDSVAPQGYMPRDLYKLDTPYGSETQLRELLASIRAAGLHSIADIVINHRCATGQGNNGAWNRWQGVRMSWDERAICSNNPQFAGLGGRKEGDDFTAAPNVDHTQDFVRKDLKDWLRWLRSDVGYDSLRFDFTKGYDGRWVGEYVDAAAPEFAVGEFWDTMGYAGGGLEYNQDCHRQRTVNWIDRAQGRCASFDFTTKGILQQAAGSGEWWRLVDKEGRPPGLLGLWPSRAVTFIDNHDTGSTQGHWPFPAGKVVLGYAYILTHPGMPMVLWDHVFDWGDDMRARITALIAARQKAGIVSRTPIRIITASAELYVAAVGERLVMKLGRGHYNPGAGWAMATHGSDYAVWVKS